ncbi:YkvA family protein [Clostridioides sp. GD02377]|uniref:YkvA family protein n=1 Tax=unclassified Clostridioides TaxID=2635829 RepID=UPI0038AD9865
MRFKKAKFGLLFIFDLLKLPDFMTDKRINIVYKVKVVSVLIFTISYFVSGVDIIPEMLTGAFGFIDDIIVLIWSIGIVNEEINRYRNITKEDKHSNIIENVEFSIKDEEE